MPKKEKKNSQIAQKTKASVGREGEAVQSPSHSASTMYYRLSLIYIIFN